MSSDKHIENMFVEDLMNDDDPIDELMSDDFMSNDFMKDDSTKIFKMLMKRRAKETGSSSARNHQRIYIDRGHEGGHAQLFKDYFSDAPAYPHEKFRRRFRMNRDLFVRIVNDLSAHSNYFTLRSDAARKVGLSPLQKCTAAIRQLAYGAPADSVDEYIRIGETTAIECVNNFCRGVIEIYGNEYLRRPNADDIQRLTNLHSTHHGFPGMLGSLDCMHWAWKNCPVAWRGQYTRGDHGYPTIMLEAVASQDLWIWHAYFGVAGSNNDLNVLNQSPLFCQTLQGRSPPVEFTINGTLYNTGYYLADGIYPRWSTMVKSFSHPRDPKRKKFKRAQEAARKDVERAFGVLQSRWAIIRGAARQWDKSRLKDIMYACIILHNMIVEDEGEEVRELLPDEEMAPPTDFSAGPTSNFHNFQTYVLKNARMRDPGVHEQLRSDLVEHIWHNFRPENNENEDELD